MADIEIRTERVDDIPLLLRQQAEMGIPDVLDAAIKAHGNRQGLSAGWLADLRGLLPDSTAPNGDVPELLGRLVETVWQRKQTLQQIDAPLEGALEAFAVAGGCSHATSSSANVK